MLSLSTKKTSSFCGNVALPDMFHFLNNPRVAKTTNALESFFGHIKENVTLHRGMSYKHYQNYVKWYLYFRNTDNKKRGK